MEEIAEKEKDLKQLVSVTSFLFERSQDLTYKSEDQSNQLQLLMAEQSKIEDQAHQSQMMADQQKSRLQQLERINVDLERQVQDYTTELTELRGQQRKFRETEAMQADVSMEWQSKLHEKEQEINLLAAKYEKKLKSI